MSAPFKNDTPIIPRATGAERLAEIIADSEGAGKFLPHPVGLRDMDKSVQELLKTGELSVTPPGANAEPVPVIWQQSELGAGRTQSWHLLSGTAQNYTPPLMSLLRGSEVPGTLYGTKSVIPQNQSYTYLRLPTFVDGQKGMERWRVPQPTPVDVPYTVTMVARLTRELNPFIERFVRAFASLQLYLPVNGHQFPLTLREGDKAGTMEEINGDRYYLKAYNLLLQGYLLDEQEYTREDARELSVVLVEANQMQLERFTLKGTVQVLRPF
jgi:hypothetical protein